MTYLEINSKKNKNICNKEQVTNHSKARRSILTKKGKNRYKQNFNLKETSNKISKNKLKKRTKDLK